MKTGGVHFSLGFMKPSPIWPFGSSKSFGSPGAGGCLGFADPDAGVGYAYVTSQMGTRLTGDPRELALRDALYTAIRVSSGLPRLPPRESATRSRIEIKQLSSAFSSRRCMSHKILGEPDFSASQGARQLTRFLRSQVFYLGIAAIIYGIFWAIRPEAANPLVTIVYTLCLCNLITLALTPLPLLYFEKSPLYY